MTHGDKGISLHFVGSNSSCFQRRRTCQRTLHLHTHTHQKYDPSSLSPFLLLPLTSSSSSKASAQSKLKGLLSMAAALTITPLPRYAIVMTTALPKSGQACHSFQLAAPSRTSQLSTHCRAAQLETTPTSREVESIFKVFSDDTTGVVCYRNEYGEMVCEGPDEGPHFYPQFVSQDASSSIYVPENQAAGILQLMYEI